MKPYLVCRSLGLISEPEVVCRWEALNRSISLVDAVLNKASDGGGGLQLDSVCEGDVGFQSGCDQTVPLCQGRIQTQEESQPPAEAEKEESRLSGDVLLLSGGGDSDILPLSGGGEEVEVASQCSPAAERGVQSDEAEVHMLVAEVLSQGECTSAGDGASGSADDVMTETGAGRIRSSLRYDLVVSCIPRTPRMPEGFHTGNRVLLLIYKCMSPCMLMSQ